MIFELDDKISFSKRHKDETIRQILRYDSGYIKDLIMKNDEFALSEESFSEACRLTKGMHDNWEKPNAKTDSIFDSLKPYGSPYPFDLNDEDVRIANQKKLIFNI